MRPLLALLVLAAGCAPERGAPASDSAARGATAAAVRPADADTAQQHAADGELPVFFARERTHDLTGDGRPERLTAMAAGPTVDSLQIRLAIHGPDGRLLYLSRWDSPRYFYYTNRRDYTTAEAEHEVRRHLERLLADSAFVPRTTTDARGRVTRVDSAAIRYDLAEQATRRRLGLADTLPLPPGTHTTIAEDDRRVQREAATRARLNALVAELARMPTFTWFAGGEVTTTIAWSASEGRFVKVWECC